VALHRRSQPKELGAKLTAQIRSSKFILVCLTISFEAASNTFFSDSVKSRAAARTSIRVERSGISRHVMHLCYESSILAWLRAAR
jgi:hypothetical protein